MATIKIETIKQYELYVKKVCKDKKASREFEELILKAFFDGINFQLGRLYIDDRGENLGLGLQS